MFAYREILRILAHASMMIAVAGCQRGETIINAASPPAESSCYEGPIELTVRYGDGTPAPNVPVGLGIVLWQPGAGMDRFRLNHKTPYTDENGVYRRMRWRECMVPTWLFAADEQRGLAALLPLEQFDQIAGPHVLTLRNGCRVRGRALSTTIDNHTVKSKSTTVIILYPEWKPSSRPLKCVCADDRTFCFLVPPGRYTIFRRDSSSLSDGIKIEVPRGKPNYDLGELFFEQNRRFDGSN